MSLAESRADVDRSEVLASARALAIHHTESTAALGRRSEGEMRLAILWFAVVEAMYLATLLFGVDSQGARLADGTLSAVAGGCGVLAALVLIVSLVLSHWVVRHEGQPGVGPDDLAELLYAIDHPEAEPVDGSEATARLVRLELRALHSRSAAVRSQRQLYETAHGAWLGTMVLVLVQLALAIGAFWAHS